MSTILCMAKKIIMLQERRKEESCCLLKIHIELTSSVLIWKLHFYRRQQRNDPK